MDRPEGLGIVPAIVFLLVTIHEQLLLSDAQSHLIEYNAALLSICLTILLGFIDDVIDLKWRDKLIVPTIASIPLLVAYKGLTSVVVPTHLRGIMGSSIVDLGFIYYIYMGMLAVFCTNSINIYAGINGIEVGQSFIIGCFILIHNLIVSNQNKLTRLGTQIEHLRRIVFKPPFFFDIDDSIPGDNIRITKTKRLPF